MFDFRNVIQYTLIFLYNKIQNGYGKYYKNKLGYCGNNVVLQGHSFFGNPQNIFLHDNVNIYSGFRFINYSGKFIMKDNSGAAQGLTVVTGNHGRELGKFFKENMQKRDLDVEQDIVVEEDVWIAANVTLLAGAIIGRGATIGANSVVRSKIPPYAIVIGNPAKIIGFNFSPEEVVEHEKKLYPENKRLPIDILKKNYEKFFLNRVGDIKQYYQL